MKVGVEQDAAAPGAAAALLDGLARCGHPVVPVFIADQGVDTALCSTRWPWAWPG